MKKYMKDLELVWVEVLPYKNFRSIFLGLTVSQLLRNNNCRYVAGIAKFCWWPLVFLGVHCPLLAAGQKESKPLDLNEWNFSIGFHLFVHKVSHFVSGLKPVSFFLSQLGWCLPTQKKTVGQCSGWKKYFSPLFFLLSLLQIKKGLYTPGLKKKRKKKEISCFIPQPPRGVSANAYPLKNST